MKKLLLGRKMLLCAKITINILPDKNSGLLAAIRKKNCTNIINSQVHEVTSSRVVSTLGSTHQVKMGYPGG
jgi:hypothetical protein